MVFSAIGAIGLLVITSFVKGDVEDDQAHCRPQHVHIAYGDSLEQMVVVWATEGTCSTMLEFTTRPWQWSWTVAGNSTEFWEQNNLGLHYLHRVKLINLLASTTYYYRPFSSGISGGPFYFKTVRTDVGWSPRLLVFGDLGVHTQTIPSLVEEALKGEYTALIHAGDFAYDLKDDKGLVGDMFMELIQPVAAFLPYMTCPGNHEIDSDTFTHYNHRFSMPGSPWPMSVDKMWYSFNVGPAHFISYSTEVFFTSEGQFVQKQYDWLVSDLRQANRERSLRPWIIAFGHRPMYCSASDGDDCTKNSSLVRAGLEDLFFGFGVDIVLQAHHHVYERQYPMYRGVILSSTYVDPPAPVQIISGAAGSSFGISPFLKHPKPEWTAVRVEEEALNSYGRLHVVNVSHVYWEEVSFHDEAVLDSLWIVQRQHRKFRLSDLSQNLSTEQGSSLEGVTLSDVFAEEDPEEEDRRLKQDDVTQRIAIGSSFAALFAILVVVAILSRSCRRWHNKTVRRWEAQDLDYGRKPFTPLGRDDDDDDLADEEQDVDLDMGDMDVHSKTLLNKKFEGP